MRTKSCESIPVSAPSGAQENGGGKAFAQVGHLATHRRVHTGVCLNNCGYFNVRTMKGTPWPSYDRNDVQLVVHKHHDEAHGYAFAFAQ